MPDVKAEFGRGPKRKGSLPGENRRAMQFRRRFLLMIIPALISCTKEGAEPTSSGSGTQVGSVGAFFRTNVNEAKQHFTLDATAGGTIIGDLGTSLTFQPNAFLTSIGTLVSGTVEIELMEILDYREMVLLDKQSVTVVGDRPRLLSSGGELFINAKMAGNDLDLAPGSMQVFIPDSTPDFAMELYSGTEDPVGNLFWHFSGTRHSGSGIHVVERGGIPGYQFAFDSLSYVNCDMLAFGDTTVIHVDVPAEYDSDSTFVYVVFPTLNAATSAEPDEFGRTTAVVLVGVPCVVVALAGTAGQYFSSFLTSEVTAEMTISISFAPTTLAQFTSDVHDL